jgi:hypothetical protein
MKTTYPLFKWSTSITKRPIDRIIDITYHTILPCIIVYLIMYYQLAILFPFLLVPIFIRYQPEEIWRNR